MKNHEPLKADWNGRRSKGGIRSGARPGGKGVARRNHEAAFMAWNGRASKIAECGMRIEKKTQKSEIRNRKSEMGG